MSRLRRVLHDLDPTFGLMILACVAFFVVGYTIALVRAVA